nr:MAG TPA: hypothetical protein [Caudoviricetes sp.]
MEDWRSGLHWRDNFDLHRDRPRERRGACSDRP